MEFLFLSCHLAGKASGGRVAKCRQFSQTKVTKYRQVHAHSFIMGNQGKIVGNSKICMGIQSQLNLPELYLTLSF